jgi:peptide/nickel transport system substrate-binding protein
MGDSKLRSSAVAVTVVLLVASCTSTASTTTPQVTTTTTSQATSTTADRCGDVFCVELEIDRDATWSDGVPVTAADLAHTFEVAARSSSLPYYRWITSVDEVDAHTVWVTFSDGPVPVGTLLEAVLPAHDTHATTGGFTVIREGEDLALRRVGDRGGVGEVRVVALEGVRGVVQALRRNEIDVAWLADPPAWATAEIRTIEGMTVRVGPGPDWEMITFNQGNRTLANDWVRKAIAHAIDRRALAEATVRTVDPDAALLDSTLRMNGTDQQVEPYPLEHDPQLSRRILSDNGCSVGDDGVWVCEGVRLSFVWATTAGDAWREAILERAAEMLEEVGIEVVPSLLVPSELFAESYLFGDGWDVINFAWEAQENPLLAAELYRCRGSGPHGFGELNIGRHCHPSVDDFLEMAFESEGPVRHGAMGGIDKEFLDAAAMIPLFQRPVVLVARSGLGLPEVTPFGGPFWRLDAWQGEATITLGLTRLPGDPAQVGPLDPVTESLRRALYRGAFGPDGEIPNLVTRFTVFRGQG